MNYPSIQSESRSQIDTSPCRMYKLIKWECTSEKEIHFEMHHLFYKSCENSSKCTRTLTLEPHTACRKGLAGSWATAIACGER